MLSTTKQLTEMRTERRGQVRKRQMLAAAQRETVHFFNAERVGAPFFLFRMVYQICAVGPDTFPFSGAMRLLWRANEIASTPPLPSLLHYNTLLNTIPTAALSTVCSPPPLPILSALPLLLQRSLCRWLLQLQPVPPTCSCVSSSSIA